LKISRNIHFHLAIPIEVSHISCSISGIVVCEKKSIALKKNPPSSIISLLPISSLYATNTIALFAVGCCMCKSQLFYLPKINNIFNNSKILEENLHKIRQIDPFKT